MHNNNEVADYYRKNSRFFNLFGIDTKNKNIHQPLWTDDIKSMDEAVNYSNKLILEAISDWLYGRKKKLSILDAGCGFGASLNYLKEYLPSTYNLEYHGITLDPFQAEYCRNNLLAEKDIINGDFQQLSKYLKDIDIIYSIESIAHADDLDQLLNEFKNVINNDGLFIVIDDFLVGDSWQHTDIINYKKNWFTRAVTTKDNFESMAKKAGFKVKKSQSLSNLIKQSFRTKFVRLLYWLGLRSSKNSYLKSIIGGAARQEAILKNLLDYRIIILQA